MLFMQFNIKTLNNKVEVHYYDIDQHSSCNSIAFWQKFPEIIINLWGNRFDTYFTYSCIIHPDNSAQYIQWHTLYMYEMYVYFL